MEARLFEIYEWSDIDQKRDEIHRFVSSFFDFDVSVRESFLRFFDENSLSDANELIFVFSVKRLITSLPIVNQQLLVLLFGTFQTIACASEVQKTGMSSEALGISVAPSFFHSCITEGCKTAKMEDIQRYKVRRSNSSEEKAQ